MRAGLCILSLLCGALLAKVAPSPLPAEGNETGASDDANGTSITGDRLDVVTTKDGHRFLCVGNVVVKGVNLLVTCDELDVLSHRDALGREEGSKGGRGRVSAIVAKGKVEIRQDGRRATADEATIDVREGIIILRGSAVVWDERGKVMGEVIVLERGRRRAEVRGSDDERPKVILPPLPDLGFDRKRDKEKDE